MIDGKKIDIYNHDLIAPTGATHALHTGRCLLHTFIQ